MIFKKSLCLLILLIMLYQSDSFILEVTKGYHKCFKAEPSPDKTLETKFNFPRRQRQNCDILFTMDLIQQDGVRKNIHHDMHRCHQMNPGQPVVIKHTTESFQLDAIYEICLDVIDDNNNGLFIEIFIGQKLNPMLYGETEKLPLIQSQQLIDLDMKIQNIRRSLSWSRKLLTEGKEKGDMLEAQLIKLDDFTINATIFQTVFLLVYGAMWILFIRNQKIN